MPPTAKRLATFLGIDRAAVATIGKPTTPAIHEHAPEEERRGRSQSSTNNSLCLSCWILERNSEFSPDESHIRCSRSPRMFLRSVIKRTGSGTTFTSRASGTRRFKSCQYLRGHDCRNQQLPSFAFSSPHLAASEVRSGSFLELLPTPNCPCWRSPSAYHRPSTQSHAWNYHHLGVHLHSNRDQITHTE
jgi:hypothetical protein